MQNDLISRSALLEEWKKKLSRMSKDRDGAAPIDFRLVVSALEDTPAVDAVEVVRCKDCIYYETGKDYLPYCNHADGGIDDYPREDDFCSYGERRADNGR